MANFYNVLFSNGEQSHILRYEIVDSPVSRIWMDQVRTMKSFPDCHVYRNQWIKNLVSRDNVEDLWRNMSSNLARYNSLSATSLTMPDRPAWDDSDRETLNYLHLEFHKFAEPLEKQTSAAAIMDRLNMDIHNVEAMMGELEVGVRSQSAGFFLTSKTAVTNQIMGGFATIPAPIYDRGLYECWDYDEQYGDLLLSYHTIGKSLYSCWLDNDQEVVKSGMVRPQVTISNEVVMGFKEFEIVDSFAKTKEDMLEWVYANGLEKFIDPNLPENSAVGRPLLGRLVKKYSSQDIEEVLLLGNIADAWLT